MDLDKEYHDPDYPEGSSCVKNEQTSDTDSDKIVKIRNIIRREFGNELELRENEVLTADRRMLTARRLLHRLRYSLVTSYYESQKLQLTASQINEETVGFNVSNVVESLKDGQGRIHPSVRKLLGKDKVDLEEILKFKGPRNKPRKDYSAMAQAKNVTIQADFTTSLRPEIKQETEVIEEPCSSKVKKIPRHIEPKITNVFTLDEVTRNKMKHRYRIIIGNTSKYVPPASRLDRSTHKWLLYVRGLQQKADLSRVVTAVTVKLHHSYAPHHTVHIDKPPYQVSRRGWGEFPARVQLHFAHPDRNRPAEVEHTLRLDRHYTGLQTLGAETVVDVWLYSTPDMLPFEYKEDDDDTQAEIQPKTEPMDPLPEIDVPTEENNIGGEDWMNFFTTNSTELDVDEMIIKPDNEIIPIDNIKQEINYEIDDDDNNDSTDHQVDDINNDCDDPPKDIPASPKKRIMKYIDPITGKIYYLEMDRSLDLSTVQEIVINSEGNIKTAKISPIKKNGVKNRSKNVSLLIPGDKELVKGDLKEQYSHISNDHCYLKSDDMKQILVSESVLPDVKSVATVKLEQTLYNKLCDDLKRLYSVRVAVNYLLRKIPLISDQARDPDFLKDFPFVVDNEEFYWKLDFAKRRNIEWSRANLINRMLKEQFKANETIWRTKQILIYSRLHGFYQFRSHQNMAQNSIEPWPSWCNEPSIKSVYPNESDITSLSIFKSDNYSPKKNDFVYDITDSDEDIDIVSTVERKFKQEVDFETRDLKMLPVLNDDDRLKFVFVEKLCSDIGIELRNEDVGNGFSYSAVHAVLLSALMSFAEEVIRASLADRLADNEYRQQVWIGSSTSPTSINLQNVYRATSSCPRLRLLTAHGRAKLKPDVLLL